MPDPIRPTEVSKAVDIPEDRDSLPKASLGQKGEPVEPADEFLPASKSESQGAIDDLGWGPRPGELSLEQLRQERLKETAELRKKPEFKQVEGQPPSYAQAVYEKGVTFLRMLESKQHPNDLTSGMWEERQTLSNALGEQSKAGPNASAMRELDQAIQARWNLVDGTVQKPKTLMEQIDDARQKRRMHFLSKSTELKIAPQFHPNSASKKVYDEGLAFLRQLDLLRDPSGVDAQLRQKKNDIQQALVRELLSVAQTGALNQQGNAAALQELNQAITARWNLLHGTGRGP